MKFGLNKDQYDYIKSVVVSPLEKLGGHVYIYGSRSRGDHQKFSDLDLMVEGSESLKNQLGSIKETLEESHFPYKVDLVHLNDFAEAYLENYQKDKKSF